MTSNKLGMLLIFVSSFAFADTSDNLNNSVAEFKLMNELVQNEAILHEVDNIPCHVVQNVTTTLSISATRYIHWFALAGCGGGNHHEEYIMLVQQHGENWTNDHVLRIGGDYSFTVTHLVWKNSDSITVHGKTWGNEDSHCCPTKPMKKVVKVVSNKLKIM